MTSDQSLTMSFLNLPRRGIAVGLADPHSNPDVNPHKKLMERKCTLVSDLPIFAVKNEAFSRNISCDELDLIRWFFFQKGSANITQKYFIKRCIPRIMVIEITKDDKCYRFTFPVSLYIIHITAY